MMAFVDGLLESSLFSVFVVVVLVLAVLFKLRDFANQFSTDDDSDDTLSLQGIERQFRDALLVLAANADDQVRCTEPGDVPEEVVDDFLLWGRSYRQQFNAHLSEQVKEKLDELLSLVDCIPDSAFRETNLLSMQQPEWQPLRDEAIVLLKLLNWQIQVPQGYVDMGNGLFEKKINDQTNQG